VSHSEHWRCLSVGKSRGVSADAFFTPCAILRLSYDFEMKIFSVLALFLSLTSISSWGLPRHDFSILKKQLDESGIYEKAAFEKIKKCVTLASKVAEGESIGGIGLDTKVSSIEKLTKCKLDPKNVSKDEQGLTTWDFKDCDLVVIFKDEYPLTIVAGGKSTLKMKSGISIGSPLKLAKKKFSNIDLRENSRETVISTPVCEIPDVCAFNYPTLSIRGNTYDGTVTQFEINRYSGGFCTR
jgi:hypothetical protein